MSLHVGLPGENEHLERFRLRGEGRSVNERKHDRHDRANAFHPAIKTLCAHASPHVQAAVVASLFCALANRAGRGRATGLTGPDNPEGATSSLPGHLEAEEHAAAGGVEGGLDDLHSA